MKVYLVRMAKMLVTTLAITLLVIHVVLAWSPQPQSAELRISTVAALAGGILKAIEGWVLPNAKRVEAMEDCDRALTVAHQRWERDTSETGDLVEKVVESRRDLHEILARIENKLSRERVESAQRSGRGGR